MGDNYIFFDPGEHTGWVSFDHKGDVIEMGTCNTQDQFYDFLADLHLGEFKVVGYEIFTLYPWKSQAQMWNEFITSQVIGAIKYAVHDYNSAIKAINSKELIELVGQSANVMSMGYMYAGMEPPKPSNPLRHQLSAFAHGVYWLQNNGVRKPQQGRVK